MTLQNYWPRYNPNIITRARFQLTDGPGSQGTIAAQFNCEGTTLSGVEFELCGAGYRVSLVKRRFVSGDYNMLPSHLFSPHVSTLNSVSYFYFRELCLSICGVTLNSKSLSFIPLVFDPTKAHVVTLF